MNQPANALSDYPHIPWTSYAHPRYRLKRLPECTFEVIQFLTGRTGKAIGGFDVMSARYRNQLKMLLVYGVSADLVQGVEEKICASEWLHYVFGEDRSAELVRPDHIERVLEFIVENGHAGDPRERLTQATIRLPAEGDERLRERVSRTARIARVLVEACLANHDVQRLIADPNDGHTQEAIRENPIVRLDYEEAYAVATIGEGLCLTEGKHWGTGPQILPLDVDCPVDGKRILYTFKENSRYNRRFEQRQRMKKMLGKEYRTLVERAKYGRHNLKVFLRLLQEDEAAAIRRVFGVEPNVFRRAARGKLFLDLPPEEKQVYFEFMGDD